MASNTSIFKTKAEQYMNIVSIMTRLSEEHLEFMGAVLIAELTAASFAAAVSGNPEPLPKAKDCVVKLYQFSDLSLLWHTRVHDSTYVHLQGIYNGKYIHSKVIKAGESLQEEQPKKKEYPTAWDEDLYSLKLGTRAHNCVMAQNIQYLGELIARSEWQVRNFHNVGKATLQEIMAALERKGLKLGTNTGDWRAPRSK